MHGNRLLEKRGSAGMTQITLTLPDVIVAQLDRQIKQRNMSLDDFVLKLSAMR